MLRMETSQFAPKGMKLKMSKEAFEEYKTILIRLAQLVFREPTQKEIVRMDNLNIMNSGIF